MSRDEIQRRPERVIILDADDPMTEVTGRFVWQEEHERAVEEARRAAFEAGFHAGSREAQRTPPHGTLRVEVRRRRTITGRLWRVLPLVALLCLLLTLPVLVLAS